MFHSFCKITVVWEFVLFVVFWVLHGVGSPYSVTSHHPRPHCNTAMPFLYSSRELSQWLCHDDSTVNIVVVYYYYDYYYC